MKFYYIEDGKKHGPYTRQEILERNLDPNTLLWKTGMANWEALKNFTEFQNVDNAYPPPIPDHVISKTNHLANSNKPKNDITLVDRNITPMIIVLSSIICLSIIGISIFSGYSIHKNKLNSLNTDFFHEIESTFQEKDVILDGNEGVIEGELKDTGFNPKDQYYTDPMTGQRMNYDEASATLNQFGREYWQIDSLYTVFEIDTCSLEEHYCNNKIKILKKESEDTYTIESITFSDMGYKKPESVYIEPEYIFYNGHPHKVREGYWKDYDRPHYMTCYREALEYFTIDDKHIPGAYTPDVYYEIKHFPKIGNDFYHLDTIRDYHLTPLFGGDSRRIGSINNADWKVYYGMSGIELVAASNHDKINTDKVVKIGIASSIGLTLILSLLLFYFGFLRNIQLFFKRWKCLTEGENQNTVLYFVFNLVRSNKFVMLNKDHLSTGQLSFDNSWKKMTLNYPTKSLGYEILELHRNKLILKSLENGYILEFVSLAWH